MPSFNFGDNLPLDRGNLFLELKSQNQEAHIRFVGGGSYDGKHFMKEDGKWNVSYCPRIMTNDECPFCEKYFDVRKQIKDAGKGEDMTELENDLRKYKAKITFYYPVLDRENETARIFKTTLSIRLKLEEEVKAGIDVPNFDYKIKRTEKPGSDYYTLTRLDSSMIKGLTEKEEQEVERAKEFNLEEIIHGKDSDLDIE